MTLPDGRRVGELDEEMVYEARPGQTFLLGASSWRIEEIGRDRVIVTPAPGVPGAVPFWKGDSVGRPKELGRELGAFARWAVDQSAETLERDYDLDALAARNLLDFLPSSRPPPAWCRQRPHDRRRALPRRDRRLAAVRALALRRPRPCGMGPGAVARIREELGLESDAIWSDDGIIVHLPDADELRGSDARPRAARSRRGRGRRRRRARPAAPCSAPASARTPARALLIPRAYPGRRTPLWQQRLKSQTLLEVAKRYADFPIILETYRECLRDVLDLPGLRRTAARACTAASCRWSRSRRATASPFASSLLFDYVATYMYEGDTPNAERRAAALSLDRDLLRELLGQEELRELIDADALAQVEADLQHRSDRTRAETRDALADVLRRLGDLTHDEVAERVLPGDRRAPRCSPSSSASAAP